MTRKRRAVRTEDVEETRRLGEIIGRAVVKPIVIALHGNLGSGKTAFVQGLARGLEVPPEFYITSPTFTLINEYPGRLPLYHVDLYRLDTESDPADIGLADILAGDGVVAIEWADKLPAGAFAEGLEIHFDMLSPDRREITLIGSGQPGVSLLKAVESF
jgi:tRNA threonylcarbamoyladenosine biosynthesis protein TsaE